MPHTMEKRPNPTTPRRHKSGIYYRQMWSARDSRTQTLPNLPGETNRQFNDRMIAEFGKEEA